MDGKKKKTTTTMILSLTVMMKKNMKTRSVTTAIVTMAPTRIATRSITTLRMTTAILRLRIAVDGTEKKTMTRKSMMMIVVTRTMKIAIQSWIVIRSVEHRLRSRLHS